MTYRLSILLIFCSIALFGQNNPKQLAELIAGGPVRSKPGTNSKISGHIEKGEIIYCELSKAAWLKISTIGYNEIKQVKGYVPRSQVRLIEKLSNSEKQNLFLNVLKQQQNLADRYQLGYPTADSLIHQKITEAFIEHTHRRYFPVLKILPQYICQNKDAATIQQLFATIWADGGSPEDMPPLTMALCHTCNPRWVESLINQLHNAEMRQLMLDNINWGYEAIARDNAEKQIIGKTPNPQFKKPVNNFFI